MTLNLNFDEDKHGSWAARRPLITKAIRGAGPDVLALQAVKRTPPATDQAAELLTDLPEYRWHCFARAGAWPGAGEYGSAFLARHPIEVRTWPLANHPGTEDPFGRLLLHATLAAAPSLHLFNAHLAWVPTVATDNLRDALAYIDRVAGLRVLLGDLNATPDSPLFHPLRGAGWTDAWTAVRGDDPGYTFEAPRPDRRIDYVWLHGVPAGAVRRIETVAGSEGGADLSDHLGLAAALRLPPPVAPR